jgi:DNA-binding NtrC family response regulator
MFQKCVLIGDDKKEIQDILSEILISQGFETYTASDGEEVLAELKKKTPDVVLLDIRMPKLDGLRTLERMRRMNFSIPVVMMTAYADISSAVQAMRLGAVDFITKPFENNEVVASLEKALNKETLEKEISNIRDQQVVSKKYINRENRLLRKELDFLRKEREEISLENKMGRSSEVLSVIFQVGQVSNTDFTLILQGETGTGKELLAQSIHQLSYRRKNPFIPVDCGAIPEALIERELFGYEQGVFTGTSGKRKGYFENANSGTLFLNEILNLPLTIQSKLLRALQERKIHRLGGKSHVSIDVRIITATSVDFKERIKKGTFRKDLYFKLNEFTIILPPLRKRKEDIPYLANRFLNEANEELGKGVRQIAESAIELLIHYPWPGNVQELKNVIKRAVLLASDVIEPQHLAPLIARQTTSLDSPVIHPGFKKGLSLTEITKKVAEEVEKDVIKKVLKKTDGKKSKAANFLGVDYKTLYRKLKRYGIDANFSD